jgi:RNA polymerase sigma-70 factor (ECF subfamily)
MNSEDQFEAVVNAHYAPLFRFAMSLTRSQSDAEDLTQETFHVWATKGHQLRDASKVKTWLYTTLHRAFLKTRNRRTKYAHHALEEVADELPSIAPEAAAKVDSSKVLSALARVDEIYQSAIALFYLEDYSYKEIADILDVPVGTIRSRLSRGIAQLRQILSPVKPLGFVSGKEQFEPARIPESTPPLHEAPCSPSIISLWQQEPRSSGT